ncbi:ribonuclease H-like protein [Hypoxylon argillaceum]|nr:ribonuclease H-like protein [Hypoxylon argillaceum]KAI1152269.1 ribonuclease H-like protein [Nemania diffusa]
MTATPPRNDRLWHPSRGISFSPSPAPLASLAQNSHTIPRVSAGVCHQHRNLTTAQSIGTQRDEEAWTAAVVQQATPPSLILQEPSEYEDNQWLVQPATETEESGVAVVEDVKTKSTDDPPPSVFEYKVVDSMFYAAKKSPEGSPESFWSYALYRHMEEDGELQKVKVHYCRSRHTMERVCKQYFMDEKVLGFDLEWMAEAKSRDGLKKNVSLIQLASQSRIALFHVALFVNSKDMVGPSFRSIMEDSTITKVGVHIKGDTTRLRNFLDIDSKGLMELSNLYKVVKYSKSREYHNINRRLVPLATQVEEYLHLPLFKGRDVRASNWARPLTMSQVLYSASDAYAGLHVYATLEHHRKQIDPCPPPPHYAELNLAIPLAEGVKAASSTAPIVAPTNGRTPKSPEERLTEATELVSIEDKQAKTSLSRRKKPASATITVKPLAQDSRVEVAGDRAVSYRASHPKTRSTFPQLRAYYLWHGYDLPLTTIAQLLRDPPLKTNTVAGYILSAVQLEKLPVDPNRLREVANLAPQNPPLARRPAVASTINTRSDSPVIPPY